MKALLSLSALPQTRALALPAASSLSRRRRLRQLAVLQISSRLLSYSGPLYDVSGPAATPAPRGSSGSRGS